MGAICGGQVSSRRSLGQSLKESSGWWLGLKKRDKVPFCIMSLSYIFSFLLLLSFSFNLFIPVQIIYGGKTLWNKCEIQFNPEVITDFAYLFGNNVALLHTAHDHLTCLFFFLSSFFFHLRLPIYITLFSLSHSCSIRTYPPEVTLAPEAATLIVIAATVILPYLTFYSIT